MLSKADGRKKIDEIPKTGRFANDLETISKALFADKQLHRLPSSSDSCRSEASGESYLSEPKTKGEKAKANKKPSIWSWRGLKALTSSRHRRFSCCFSLLVHSIEGLPSLFDDVCLVVHWKKQDGELTTSPTRVHEGVAEFEEQLIHSCCVNVTRGRSQNFAKYEAQNYLLYASIYNAPEIDLGKHHIDLTRLLPLTLEELEEEKSSGKWTTSFKLSGKAGGATMNVSFGYIAVVYSREPSSTKNTPDILNLRENRAVTETFVDQSDLKNELNIHRVGSLPASFATLKQSAEDIKDLHEILPMPTSELYQSVNVLYQKLDEEIPNASSEKMLDTGPFPPHLDSCKVNSFKPPDSYEKNLETELETGEFSITEKEIEEFTKEHARPEKDPCTVALASGQGIETDGIVEVTLNKEDILPPPAKDIVSQKHEQTISTCSSTEKENVVLSKESLMKELEMALSCASNLTNEELDSQGDESDAPFQESLLNSNSQHGDLGKGKSPNLDDITDLVANEFLNMLSVENSPFGLSSNSEPDSPRERLLKEFERDPLANGGILNFDIENYYPTESDSDIPTGSVWEAMSNDFYQSSILEGFRETSLIESDVFSRRASRIEDLENEALMRDWGMNEKAFQHSPPSKSGGFCNPVEGPSEDLDQHLASLSEGLGPFLQTKNGGFLRSMNPALFRNAEGGGSLIMQASSPVVVPAEMGSGVMDILQSLAAMGIEKLSMQANKLMPLEDITGKTIQQIAWEAAPSLERSVVNAFFVILFF